MASTSFRGWSTNGPGVYTLVSDLRTNVSRNPYWPGTNSPPAIDTNRVPPRIAERIREMRKYEFLTNVVPVTNLVFHHFVPDSLNNLVWTNFITHTNGRTTALWSMRVHPAGWPTNPPVVKWNPQSLAWGMRGLTGLSPCWEMEGSSGQVPITALTRRHGYTRGHGMGPEGFRTNYRGKKVWFLAVDNTLVEMTVAREVVRTHASGTADYTLLLFTQDLPQSIQPLRVVDQKSMLARYRSIQGAPYVMFLTEQHGNVSSGLPGLSAPIYKGGDSGSPNLLPMPGELLFQSGRTTSEPSRQMQADMDALCNLEGLPPERYQMEWVDLSKYPAY